MIYIAIITFNTQGGVKSKIDAVYSKIQGLYDECREIPGGFLIKSSCKSPELRDAIQSGIAYDDVVFVGALTNDWSTYSFPPATTDWLRAQKLVNAHPLFCI